MARRVIVFIELFSFALAGWFGWQWLRGGSYEPHFALATLGFALSEGIRRYGSSWFQKEGKNLDPGAMSRHAQDLREVLESEIYRCRAEKLRQDVIIRHVARQDSYPDTEECRKGISPWFRSGLMETYHSGIRVWLDFAMLRVCPDGFRLIKDEDAGPNDIKVELLGEIPFDSIEAVNIDGDEYYNYPHIFCHFNWNGEPYKRKAYFERNVGSHGHPWYREIATYESVKLNNNDHDLDKFA